MPTPTPTPTLTPTPTSIGCWEYYCISNTGNNNIDDNYVSGGTYNDEIYWVGTNNGNYIYYDNNQWCLSSSLGGSCILSGKSPCVSTCPDLCHDYFTIGICPTPTPTPTLPCNVDFEVLFDCEFTPTPSVSQTPTITPTITPTSSSVVSVLSVEATVFSYTPTPSVTPTITPSTTPLIIRPCNFTGNVSFNNVNEIIKCPFSKQFQDCFNGDMYYTTNELINPSGGDIEQFMVFEGLIDGVSRCISYVGENQDTIGINIIELSSGPFGFSNLGDCINCTPIQSQTPTPTPTPSVTPTITPTPSNTPLENSRYVYVRCDDETIYVVQTSPGPITVPNSSFINLNDNKCWSFLYVTSGYPPINPNNTVINYSGNYFTQISNQVFKNCDLCVESLSLQPTSVPITTSVPVVPISPQQNYSINYSITKTDSCSKTSGVILVNNVVNYKLTSELPSGNYSGSFNVKDGDVVVFDFNTFDNGQSCVPLNSRLIISDTKRVVNEFAEYGNTNQSIYNTYVVNTDWLGNTIIITSDVIG